MNLEKQLEKYINLPYRMEIEEVMDEDGKYFYASIPELGKFTCYASGATVQEAVDNLKNVKEIIIEDLLKSGKEVPLPRKEEEILPSGKFVVRISPRLHARLIDQAKEEKISLNLLVNELLATRLSYREILKNIDVKLKYKNDNKNGEDKSPCGKETEIKGIEQDKIKITNSSPFEAIVGKKGWYKELRNVSNG